MRFENSGALIPKQINGSFKICTPYDIFTTDGAGFDKAFEVLGKVGGQIAMKVTKKWLNGWATSHRMHEDSILDCVLGCKNAADSLNHYVHCPHLFAIQRYLFEDISEYPIIRFGIKAPGFSNLKVLSCVFTAYHASKGDIRAKNQHALS